MKANIITAGFIMAWLVAPESLALLGRVSGIAGLLVIVLLLTGVILAICSAALIHGTRLVGDGKGGEVAVLSATYGRTAAAVITLSGRVPMVLFASTGMLVSAGFAFNEIFIYWFPNFLFASFLLMIICILNLFEEDIALRGQLVFAGVAILGLLTLIIMGAGGSELNQAQQAPLPYDDLSLPLFGMIFLLFLGFDFYRPKEKGAVPVIITLVLAFLLLTGWALLSIEFVAASKLVNSTIPHLLVAREVGGETGRYIMGMVIICGALSGVNGLFLATRRTFAALAEDMFFPAMMKRGWPVSLLCAITIEVMMMTGFAGEEILETQLRASLLLWLFYLAIRSYAAGLQLDRLGERGLVYGSIVGSVILLLAGSLTMVHTGYILSFAAVFLIGFYLIAFVMAKIDEKKSLQL